MGKKDTILVGTIGQGIMILTDNGATWQRVSIRQGLHHGGIVRSLVNHQQRPEVVFAGTDRGVYRSTNGGDSWQRLQNDFSNSMVWSLTMDRRNSNVLFAGTGTTTPAGLFCSEDSGDTWEQVKVPVSAECPIVGVPRFTGMATDPDNLENMWATLEVDGVRRSTDGGQTWFRPEGDPRNPDAHDVLVSAGTTYILVNDEVWTSFDGGSSWSPVNIQSKLGWGYPHRIFLHPEDPKTVYVVGGDSTPGVSGTILRSTDAGKNWEALKFSVAPNSAIWALGMSAANSNFMFAASRHGYLYSSEDGGDNWAKLSREMGEVSAIVVVPN